MKRYPFIKQDDLKDCGATSLAMILKYHGGYVPIEVLKEMTFTTKEGTTAYHIVEAAKELGFNSYGMKLSLEQLKQEKIAYPVIASVLIDGTYKHFVVIYEIDVKTNELLIADPADRLKKMSFADFEKIYQNVIMVMNKVRTITKMTNDHFFLKKIKSIYLKNIKLILLIIFLMFIYMFLNLLNLFYIKELLNSKKVYLILVLIIILKEIINYLKNRLIIFLNKKTSLHLEQDIFKEILNLPYAFYRNKTTGEIVTRFNDLEKVKNLFNNLFLNISLYVITIFSSMMILSFLDFKLFLLPLMTVIIYFIINKLFQKKINSKISSTKIKQGYLNTNIIESINGFETIKGLNLEEDFLKKHQNINESFESNLSTLRKEIINESFLKNLISEYGHLSVLAIGMLNTNITNLFIFITLLNYFEEPVKEIINSTSDIKEGIIAYQRINNLYYKKEEKKEKEEVKKIKTNNLNYSLNKVEPLLTNVDIEINMGEKIALIGASGSGKSTFLKLIKKYYPNAISINDSIKPNKSILYVSQNEILFTDTLYNNLTLGKNIPLNKLNEIISICSLNEFINNKELGLNTLIEENGFNISGGEKERIILARTILNDFDVLLLDESLNEVDISLERKILKNLFKKYPNKTIILITHRLDNLDLFDSLMKVENKKIEKIRRNVKCGK